jgi:hypothetical protein
MKDNKMYIFKIWIKSESPHKLDTVRMNQLALTKFCDIKFEKNKCSFSSVLYFQYDTF